MTCVPRDSTPHLLEWGCVCRGGRRAEGGRGSSASPGVGVVEQIKVQNWFPPNLSWLMWQVAAVSASPPRPRMSPPGSSLWHRAKAGSGRREERRRSSSEAHSSRFTCPHLKTETDKVKKTWHKNMHTHKHGRELTYALAHFATPPLVTHCCAEPLTHQAQVSDTNYSRGLHEGSAAWPWHSHRCTRTHTHTALTRNRSTWWCWWIIQEKTESEREHQRIEIYGWYTVYIVNKIPSEGNASVTEDFGCSLSDLLLTHNDSHFTAFLRNKQDSLKSII